MVNRSPIEAKCLTTEQKALLDQQFSTPLLAWYDKHGRQNLPWQHPRSAYRVWISEIMLQQTQVKTVIPYFERFIQIFPDIWQLAQAPEDAVLALWSGLGYYSRARHIMQTAKIICEKYAGNFPSQLTELNALPGIGPSTAAAIASQAFNLPAAILDGNVKRVLCRYFLIAGLPEQSLIKQQLWRLANQCMPTQRCADYTQAIMDLGAMCCTLKQPKCNLCPLQASCLANLHHQSHAYPQKKPKKILPVKQQLFLLIYDEENKIYLEKRPPTGLWGGLWCLPNTEDLTACPMTHIKKSHALIGLKSEELIKIKHSLSHFHLHIKALAIQAITATTALTESRGHWFEMRELHHLGLAKPVADIIKYFFNSL